MHQENNYSKISYAGQNDLKLLNKNIKIYRNCSSKDKVTKLEIILLSFLVRNFLTYMQKFSYLYKFSLACYLYAFAQFLHFSDILDIIVAIKTVLQL